MESLLSSMEAEAHQDFSKLGAQGPLAAGGRWLSRRPQGVTAMRHVGHGGLLWPHACERLLDLLEL